MKRRKDGKRKRRKSGRKAERGKGRRKCGRKVCQGGRKLKRRKWQKRAVDGRREAVMSEQIIEALNRKFRLWLWETFRMRDLSLEDTADEIGMSRPGFTDLLRFHDEQFYFETFLRTIFLRRECVTGVELVEEGWSVRLWWEVRKVRQTEGQ
jgi:AraC-like DNA-binding protein